MKRNLTQVEMRQRAALAASQVKPINLANYISKLRRMKSELHLLAADIDAAITRLETKETAS